MSEKNGKNPMINLEKGLIMLRPAERKADTFLLLLCGYNQIQRPQILLE